MKYLSYIICFILAGSAASSQACYSVSEISYNPDPFNAGTAVVLSDDDVSGALPIGFTFCYFGNLYTQFYIGSNGWLGFSAGQTTAYTTASIPSTSFSVPKNCIMGPWQDWHPGILGGPYIRYQTLGVAPNRRLVVSFNNCPMFLCTSTLGTFQIRIYETSNIIENHIQNKPNCLIWAGGTAVQGIHDLSGTIAFTVPGRNSTQWTITNEAHRYTPSCVACVPTAPLPIELLLFTAKSNRKNIELEWTTVSESNNDYFTIEKSKEGIYFEKVVIVEGAGNSNSILNYKIIDDKPLGGVSYYRLKQTDFDGKYTYSKIISVKYDQTSVFSISPMPVSNMLTIYFNSVASGNSSLLITDSKGQIILSKEIWSEQGSNILEIDVSAVPGGIYLIKIQEETGEEYTSRMVKM